MSSGTGPSIPLLLRFKEIKFVHWKSGNLPRISLKEREVFFFALLGGLWPRDAVG